MVAERPLRVSRYEFLGRIGYAAAQEMQREAQRALKAGKGEERLLLLEHPPVFTLGRNAAPADIAVDAEWLNLHGVEIHESDRGGQVTYHGPGQLVGYPVLDLAPDRKDVRRYVRDLAKVLVATLGDFGIAAETRPAPHIGVWVGERKIASLGIHLSRWITTHGFALNVRTDLDHFAAIVPCGLPEVQMVSMERLLPSVPDLRTVSEHIVHHFGEVFGRTMLPVGVDQSA